MINELKHGQRVRATVAMSDLHPFPCEVSIGDVGVVFGTQCFPSVMLDRPATDASSSLFHLVTSRHDLSGYWEVIPEETPEQKQIKELEETIAKAQRQVAELKGGG